MIINTEAAKLAAGAAKQHLAIIDAGRGRSGSAFTASLTASRALCAALIGIAFPDISPDDILQTYLDMSDASSRPSLNRAAEYVDRRNND